MAVTIKRFRISLFWVTRFATLLDDASPAGAPFAALGHIDTYAPIFSRLLAAPNQPVSPAVGAPELELPWPTTGTHWFWFRYLNANPIQRLSGSFAFTRLVPLRRRKSPEPGLGVVLPPELAAAKVMVESVRSEAWFHPHMVSFLLHFTVSGELSLEQMAQVCLALRRGRVMSAADSAAASLSKLDEVSAQRLNGLYLEAVGTAHAKALPPADPFTLVTVLQGQGDGQAAVDGGVVHRTLEAVTRWESGKTGALVAGLISSRAPALDGPLLFGRERARAVWDPGQFSTDGGISLSCYHRNLVVGTLQVEALLAFAGVAGDQATAGNRPNAIRACEDVVLKRIVALHSGQTTSYRSASLKRFIDDHPLRPAVKDLATRIWSPVSLP